MKPSFSGSANGEAKISELVLNDDMITQSSGTMTSSDQMTNTVCDTPPTTLSPVVVCGLRARAARCRVGARLGGCCHVVVGRVIRHLLVPPVSRFTTNTSPA